MRSSWVVSAVVSVLCFGGLAEASSTSIAVHSGMCMDVQGQSTSGGAQIIQSTCAGTLSQQLYFTLSSGYYQIKDRNSGLCLQPSGGSTSSGANIVQNTCSGSNQAMQYTTSPAGNGSTVQYELVNRKSGLCLTISGDSLTSGANVIQSACTGASNQLFVATLDSSSTEYFLNDNFGGYTANSCFADGTTFGAWTDVWGGGGCTETTTVGTTPVLQLEPTAATSSSQTYSSLSIGPSTSGDVTIDVNLLTVAQLRTGSSPNPWEVGWVLWNYTDNTHFYNFIPKTNGWELDKEDPSYPGNQRFLASGSSPTFPIGTKYDVHITQVSNTITVSVNGTQITSFTDTSNPYTSGSVGFYSEDSQVDYYTATVSH